MPRYTLRVPTVGADLHSDDGTVAFVADTIEQARDFFEDWTGERPMYLHSSIGRCRVLYKADIDAGDGHEDAHPGDTTVSYLHDSGRELAAHECRVWQLGAPPVHWSGERLPRDPIGADEVPVGTSVHHRRLGAGKTTAAACRPCGNFWYLDVLFSSGRQLRCAVSRISVLPGYNWPPPAPLRLTVAGEHVADVRSDSAFDALRSIRLDRLRAEWEAAQYDPAAFAEPAPA